MAHYTSSGKLKGKTSEHIRIRLVKQPSLPGEGDRTSYEIESNALNMPQTKRTIKEATDTLKQILDEIDETISDVDAANMPIAEINVSIQWNRR